MSNLIINGIDHSVFDLEWAKRGGIVYHYGDFCRYICDGDNYDEIRAGQDGEFLIGEEKTVLLVSILTTETVENIPYYLRMATPYECAEAGIEYIEPPMIWRDIESAPKNTWVIATDGFYVTEAFFSTPRNEWIMKNGDELSEPTHWMPLPQPPKDE